MNETMKVGIVIPVYKTKYEYLKECVLSAIHQTYRNLQIVLVDDCSPDDCGKWCDVFAARDSRIEVCHHAVNKKLPGARNTGFEHLDADYVTFMDSDDWLDPDTIERCVEVISKDGHAVDFAFFPICRNYKNMETETNFQKPIVFDTPGAFEQLQLESLNIAKKHQPGDFRMNDGAWGKLISCSFLQKNGILFRNLAYREDGMFFMEICQAAQYALAIPGGRYHYRETSGSMVNSYRKNAPAEQKAYLDMVIDFSKAYDKKPEFHDAIHYYTIVGAQTAIVQFYFNGKNESKTRRKECLNYLSQEPYKTGLSGVKLRKLNTHFLLKAVLIKLHCFASLEKIRRFYLKKNTMECYE